MTVAILAVNIGIVIDKVFVAGIIRRVYVYNINFALMGVGKCGQGFEIITFNQDMIGSIRACISQRSVFVLNEHRKFVEQTLLYIFGLILPYQTIFLVRPQKF